MTLKSHIAYFLRTHIFSLRILSLNLFNLVFWIMVIAGVNIGADRGSALIGLALGTAAGMFFHAFSYALYVFTHRDQFIAALPAPPNAGPAASGDNSGAPGGPPSVS